MSVVMNFLRGRLSLIVLPSAARLRSQWIKRISKIVFFFFKKKKKWAPTKLAAFKKGYTDKCSNFRDSVAQTANEIGQNSLNKHDSVVNR